MGVGRVSRGRGDGEEREGACYEYFRGLPGGGASGGRISEVWG